MALVGCPECGHKVSSKAKACPNCGYDLYANNPATEILNISNGLFKFFGFILIVIGLLLCFTFIGVWFGIPLIILGFTSFIFPRLALTLTVIVVILYFFGRSAEPQKVAVSVTIPNQPQSESVYVSVVPNKGIAPSFDCSKAKSTPEKLICSDDELATLDSELSELYKSARQKTNDLGALKRDTENAWKYREENCLDKQCLIKWFGDRKSYYLSY
jgi:uncharacterized protein YecT (DUF1311 family)